MKFGRLAPHPETTHPRLKLGPALDLSQIKVPDVVDYVSKVTDWPMYLNSDLGDCTVAAIGHMIEAITQYGQGATVEITNNDVETAYSAVSGYVPGDPATDNGAVMQDVLGYWKKTGVGGRKILAFAQLDIRNPQEIAAALYLFGHVYVGINCPVSAQKQFAHGQAWDVVANDGGIAGGHAIDLGYRKAGGNYRIISWGAAIDMTPAFWDRYVEEAWVAVSEEWIDATGGSPPGLDTDHLNTQYTAITGKRGPFPANPKPPAPSPWADLVALWHQIRDTIEEFFTKEKP